MVLFCYAGLLRYDEISSLCCKDVKNQGDYIILYIRKSKTDQYRQGNEVLIAKGDTIACPYTMFERYIRLAGIDLSSDVFLFRPIFRSKSSCKLIYKNKKLSYTAARQSIISKLKLVSPEANFGLHSMRSGGATAASNSGLATESGRDTVAGRVTRVKMDMLLTV